MLAPLAVSSHAWFLFNSMVTTVYVVFVVDGLGFDPFALGVTYAVAGVGAVLGSALAGRVEQRFGVGPGIIIGRWLAPLGYVLIPLASTGSTAIVLLCAAQFLFGLSIGIDGPIEMGYRQTVTPDRLQGRMNATMRSLNRGAIVLGAPLGGALADILGTRPALWIAITGLFLQAVALTGSRFRHAGLPAAAAQ
jgi:predicted MFS family arabinose efflux permease